MLKADLRESSVSGGARVDSHANVFHIAQTECGTFRYLYRQLLEFAILSGSLATQFFVDRFNLAGLRKHCCLQIAEGL